MTRHQYSESLDDWAHLHAHTIEPAPAPEYTCPTHGPYTPRSLLDQDCERCDIEAIDAAEAADAMHVWRHTTYPR